MSYYLRLALAVLVWSVAEQVWGVSVGSFSPPLGSSREQITIYGTGFDPAGTLVVTFNGVRDFTAQVTAADGTVIQAKVPTNAPLGAGPISVQVNGGSAASSLQDFTVIGPGPYITNFNPSAAGGNVQVIIGGVHFANPTNMANAAYFNGKPGTGFFVQSDSSIQVITPAGVTTGPVSVGSPRGTNTTSTNYFVPPVIVAFTPSSGRSGTNVLITGTNFLGTFAVQFFGGAFASNINVLSNGAALVTVPTNALTGTIRLYAPAGSFTTTSNFVVQPTVFGFAPGFGPVGTTVTISGENLVGTSSVKFNGVNASFSGANFNQVTATVPAATSGPISVTTTNGTVASAANFYFPASITSFTPTNSAPGSRVTITGVNFTNTSAVRFNGIDASSFTVSNNTTIGATVPAGIITGPISITTPAGTTNSTALFYGAPGITNFVPTHGLPGTNVTITGSNFLGATAVRFNGTPSLNFHVTNNTTIGATVPIGAQTGPISVVGPAGTNISASNFVLDYFCDLLVTIVDTPDPVTIGSNLVYTVSVFNNGGFNGTNVVITNTLPGSIVLKGATVTQGTLTTNGNLIIANLGVVNAGASANLGITITPQVSGTMTNIASATSDTPDSSLTNNIAVATTTVLPLPLLSIRKASTNQVRVSWPSTLTNYVLQFRTNLGSNVFWSNVTAAASNAGSENVVTETTSNASRFYRLRK